MCFQPQEQFLSRYNEEMKVKIVFFVLFAILIYTRFVNIGWGLPYPMHPDERNMAVAVQQLTCDTSQVVSLQLQDCFHPHFFAYGQFPLYLAYGGIQFLHFLFGIEGQPTFVEATIALRTISALSSVMLVFVLLKIIKLIYKPKQRPNDFTFLDLFTVLVFIFQPYAVQFAHFGTTESLLMLLFAHIIYLSLTVLNHPSQRLYHPILLGIVVGIALGTKTSSLLFLVLPILIFAFKKRWKHIMLMICVAVFFTFLSSPQSFIHWNEFRTSMDYESAVGLGTYKAFYTRQFENTTPILFQLNRIFPFALGLPMMLAGIIGFFFLSWRNKELNVLRIAFITAFLPAAFFYAKWTRFIAPAFPVITLFGVLWLMHLLHKISHRYFSFVFALTLSLHCIHGAAYLSVYTRQDVRFTASEWMYKNIPENSSLLSETANVVDIPIPPPNYGRPIPNYLVMSFNFYDLDSNPELQSNLKVAIDKADYIIIPSRRIVKNHPATDYPLVASYYDDLFSGKSGFTQIGEIASYPSITLMGKTIWEWNDEDAEETWTVFDHPVVRIYKKVESLKVAKPQSQNIQLDFSNYKTTDFRLSDVQTFRLLVADSPEKWERGLMYVRSKADIGGLDGMIFRFPKSEVQSFWNKNTVSDLTLYWLDNRTIVGTTLLPSVEKTGSVVTVFSPVPADTVVELLPD